MDLRENVVIEQKNFGSELESCLFNVLHTFRMSRGQFCEDVELLNIEHEIVGKISFIGTFAVGKLLTPVR